MDVPKENPVSTIVTNNSNDIKDDSNCDKIFEDFLKIYPKMAESIKDEHFEDVLKIVQKENMTFNIDTLRTNFVESLTEILKKMYESRDLKKKLTVVNLLDERYKKKKNSNWHPHGKDAEEQTTFQRITLLNRRKNFMMKLLLTQQKTLEETASKVTKNRKRMEELKARRAELNFILDKKMDELRCIQDEYTKLNSGLK